MMDKSSGQQQGPVWSHEWMNGDINAELWQGTENKKIQSRICKSKISPYSKGRRGENEIKPHEFVLPTGS